MAAEFRGRIAQDIRDSVPDWEPYREPQAPDGAPNVLYVVWDDVGFGTFDFYTLAADVRLDTPEVRGVLFAQGGRFGGHSLCLLDGRLHYLYNCLGRTEQKIGSPDRVPVGDHILSAAFRADDRKDNGLTAGTLTLRVDGREVGAIRIRTQPGMFACDGEGLCVGRDSGQAVSADYDPPFHFLGGTIREVLVDVSGRPFADLEKEATGAFMRY